MRTKFNDPREDYISAARDGMLVVFDQDAFCVGPRKQKPKLIEEGTVIKLRRVESDGKGNLKLWGIENKDGDWRVVKAASVKIYTGRVPAWRLEMFLVEHGYQADTYASVQPTRTECRDYGGSLKIEQQVERLQRLCVGWIRMFKRRL